MTTKDWMALSDRQRHALAIAMMVRNAQEDFHVAHLSDEQMKQLNQVTRYAIYEAISFIEKMAADPSKAIAFEWLVGSIPDYWEIPGRDPKPTLKRTA